MSPIIAQATRPSPDAAARKRADRLAKAGPDQIEAALAYLSMIDPEAFEIALTVVAPDADEPDEPDEPDEEEPIPFCRVCGAPVGIFPELALEWRHFRGDADAASAHQTYDAGHAAEVAWYLPDEAAEEF